MTSWVWEVTSRYVDVDENSYVGYGGPTCEEKHLEGIWGNVYHRKNGICSVQNQHKYKAIMAERFRVAVDGAIVNLLCASP